MPMSDGKHTLRKIAFQVGDRFFRFAINPETYNHTKPHRTTAVKTKSRIVVEDFQSDIPTISIKGTTGFNPTGRKQDRGIEKIKEMKNFLEDYAEMGGNGDLPAEEFYFHNFTNDESFVISLSAEGVKYSQDANSPLLYRYDIQFVVLRKAGQPSEDEIIQPEIGNRFPSIPNIPNIPMSPYPILPLPGWSGDTWKDNSPYYGDNNDDNFDPSSGSDNVYNKGNTKPYRPSVNNEPVNPQEPSPVSYGYGVTGLGYSIGYYGRTF